MAVPQPQDLFESQGFHKTGVPDFGDVAVPVGDGVSIMKIDEELGLREQWEQSPERPVSLLPPFGMGESSHLPTPQSPINLSGYMPSHVESPLSSDHLRAGPSRQSQTLRPPSRPESAHPPQTPQGSSPTSTPRNRLQPLPLTSQPDLGYDSFRRAGMESEVLQPSSSQIATPSPEIRRARHSSVPYTPSDSETMLATPNAGKRSSSHPYVGPSIIAPAPVISPAHSTHSTIYHSSPSANEDAPRVLKFPRRMAALVSDDTQHNQGQESPDLADPFIVRGDERSTSELPKRYPSPPPLRGHARRDSSPVSIVKMADPGPSNVVIAQPAASSGKPSDESPVKTEVEDDDIMVPLVGGEVVATASPHTPTSPYTPRHKTSVSDPHTLSSGDPTFRTPLRASGGEIDRIHRQQADLEDARIIQSEKRRPEYLVRAKRMRSSADDTSAEHERESALSDLGVTATPVKGRRLKLYQPVAISPDAVIEGKPGLEGGVTTEPKTPPPLSRMSSRSGSSRQSALPGISMRAIDWRTPVRRRQPSSALWSEEDEIKRQRRLAAFATPQASRRKRRLKPVEVVGQGRMVVDVTSPDTQALAKAGIVQLPVSDTADEDVDALADGHGAEWPDNQYPWSLQERQRDEREEAKRSERLQWIERFLDRESESEEDDTERIASPSTWNEVGNGGSFSGAQRAHGKTMSLKAPAGSKHFTIGPPIHGAPYWNAYNTLLSKKRVREVAERISKRKAAEEEEGVVMCICQRGDDGRSMVRCDECRTWYHLVCMDIEDENELGDKWYCWKCVPSAEEAPVAPASEPTFAPAVPDSPPRNSMGDLPLYQSALQPSPMLDIRSRAPVSPSVPRSSTHDRERSPVRHSGLAQQVGDPDDPVRGGPSTPYQPRSTDSRIYSTPKFYDEYADEFVPFDPTSTPSRGLKFPHTVPITPRRPPHWTPAQALPWMTPSGPPWTPQFSQAGTSSSRSLAYSMSTLEESAGPLTSPWPSEESPVRRLHKAGPSGWPYPPSRVLDSPLAVRSAANRSAYLPGVEESPTTRLFHRGKDKDVDDLTSHPKE